MDMVASMIHLHCRTLTAKRSINLHPSDIDLRGHRPHNDIGDKGFVRCNEV